MSRAQVRVVRRPIIPTVLTFLYPFVQPGLYMWLTERRGPNISYPPTPIPPQPSTSAIPASKEIEDTFIDVLVKACSCRQQTRITPGRKSTPLPAFTYHRARRRNFQSCAKQGRNVPDTRLYAQAQSASLSVSREEYMQMLDYYREPHDTTNPFAGYGPPPSAASQLTIGKHTRERSDASSPLQEESDHAMQLNQSEVTAMDGRGWFNESDGPVLHRSPPDPNIVQENNGSSSKAELPGSDQVPQPPASYNTENKQVIDHFLRILEDETASHEQIYEAYCQLPSLGVRQISDGSRRLLFHRLSVIENKSKQAMLRYLRLVDDMKEASMSMSQSEWNTAIAYAGRCFVHVDAPQVESALRIWKEMEQEAGIRSGRVTFNILFDIATKAGKYVLAEMILKEMDNRALTYNRFSHVGFIYYHGLKGDGAGVRKAYRDLVEAGQIVDTVVMNCVIASLIRAGELPAAEQVYERMKRLFHVKTGEYVLNRDWRYSRDLGRILDRASRTMRDQPERLQRLQAKQCLAPDTRTFSIFIDYHVHITGELRRITVLLAEMQDLQVPIQGRMYIKIFRGFARHGGVKYTSWTTQRLESVWTSLLGALDAQIEGIQILKWTVIWVVRAFARCCGRARALQIWEEIRDRWRVVDDNEKGAVEYLLRDVLQEPRTTDGHR
ncbi:MAG: hypothetical protein Q9166_002195 [cf. Caloplaca sp. 2 TL-2023]